MSERFRFLEIQRRSSSAKSGVEASHQEISSRLKEKIEQFEELASQDHPESIDVHGRPKSQCQSLSIFQGLQLSDLPGDPDHLGIKTVEVLHWDKPKEEGGGIYLRMNRNGGYHFSVWHVFVQDDYVAEHFYNLVKENRDGEERWVRSEPEGGTISQQAIEALGYSD